MKAVGSGESGLTTDSPFWSALEISGGSARPADVRDVVLYVASRGSLFSTEFIRFLDHNVQVVKNAGVIKVLTAQGARTSDGRLFASLEAEEVKQYVHGLTVLGRAYVDGVLKDPELFPRVGTPIDFEALLADELTQIWDQPIRPLWEERPGDRRRDGTSWLNLYFGRGVGVPDFNDGPLTVDFLGRLQKAEVLASLSDEWRALRNAAKVRTLSISLEYWWPRDEPERVARLAGRKASFVVYREFQRALDHPPSIEYWDREIADVLELVKAELRGWI